MSRLDRRPAAHGTLRGDEGALFARHHAALLRAVPSAVRAPEARSETLFGWLRTVAIHEAYELSRQQRRTTSLEHPDSLHAEGSGALWRTAARSRTPSRRAAPSGSSPPCPSASDHPGAQGRGVSLRGDPTVAWRGDVHQRQPAAHKARQRIRELEAAA